MKFENMLIMTGFITGAGLGLTSCGPREIKGLDSLKLETSYVVREMLRANTDSCTFFLDGKSYSIRIMGRDAHGSKTYKAYSVVIAPVQDTLAEAKPVIETTIGPVVYENGVPYGIMGIEISRQGNDITNQLAPEAVEKITLILKAAKNSAIKKADEKRTREDGIGNNVQKQNRSWDVPSRMRRGYAATIPRRPDARSQVRHPLKV